MKPSMREWIAARPLRSMAAVILLLGLILVICIHGDYGLTWDEAIQATYGELVLRYFSTGFTNERCNQLGNLYLYGPVFELTCAVVYKTTGAPRFEVRHLLIGLVALLSLPGLILYTRRFGSPWIPFFAVLILMTLPRYMGHAFSNSKDIPFACAFIWAMAGIAALLTGKRWTWRKVVFAGVGIGLAMGFRVGGMLLFGYLGVALIYIVLAHGPGVLRREDGRWDWTIVARGVALFLIAWTVMVLFWPWAQKSPLLHPMIALKEMSSFSETYTVMFEGRFVKSDQLPWSYFITMFFITTPVPVLALTVVGAVAAVLAIRKDRKSDSAFLAFLSLFWFLFPLLYYLVMRPNVYNGIRHFLFVLPAMSVLAGFGAHAVVQWILVRWKHPRARLVLTAAMLAVLALPVIDLIRLHPYQATFYNMTVGGTGEGWKRYGPDYWGSSYKEAVEWVAANCDKKPTVLVVTANDFCRPCAQYYLTDDMLMWTIWGAHDPMPEKYDYFIGMTHLGTHNHPFVKDQPVVHTIERGGAVHTVIRKGR